MKAWPLCLLVASLAPAATPKIPVEDFFGEAAIRQVLVSPDGTHIAFLAPDATARVGIGIMDLGVGKPELLSRAADENIKRIWWKGPRRLVFSADIGGNESDALFAIDIKSGSISRLAESYRVALADEAAIAFVLDDLPLLPDEMLLEGTDAVGQYGQAGGTFGVFRLALKSGRRDFEFTRPFGDGGMLDDDVGRYLADTSGLVRVKTVRHQDHYAVQYRSDAHSAWRDLASNPRDEFVETWRALAFNADNRTLYVVKQSGATESLFAMDPESLAYGDPLMTVPAGELDRELGGQILEFSPDRSRLTGVTAENERNYHKFFDPQRAALQQTIDHAFPNTFNTIRSSSTDEMVLTIVCQSDREPGAYYLMDRRRHLMMPLGRVYPKINPAQMAPMQPIVYAARDGLKIHGYLTLPLDRKPGQRVPLVLHPHGGPYSIRDSWGFDPEVQLLANRGYAVLQVNYRGSGGYGAEFLNAGRFEWGAKMTDDLTDAVKWAVDQGYADPKRLAVFGASYGGYCALACAVFTPDLYRCAINYVGPGDLVALTNTNDVRRYQGRDFYKQWFPADKTVLAARSPTKHVQNIRVPTLHAYGENDPRVDIGQWHELRRELDRYGKKYEFFDMANEGHGFHNESARLAFYRRVESFLAENLQ